MEDRIEDMVEKRIRKYIKEKCVAVPDSSPIDDMLFKLWGNDYSHNCAMMVIRMKKMEMEIAKIKRHVEKLDQSLQMYNCHSALLQNDRDTMRSFCSATIGGKSIAEDLALITSFNTTGGSDFSRMRQSYCHKLRKDFRKKYGPNRGKLEHRTVWDVVRGECVREDMVYIDGRWCDLRGKPLEVIDGHPVTPHGIRISGSEMYRMAFFSDKGGSLGIIDTWVPYYLDEILTIDDAPAEHSDKKQRADDS